MPKISALPPAGSLHDDDETPFVDDSAGSTKKFTLTVLKEWLQSLVGWVTDAMWRNEIAFKVYKTADQTTTSGVSTTLTFQATEYDLGGDVDLANDRFVAPVDGLYFLGGSGRIRSGSSGTRTFIKIQVNGTDRIAGTDYGSQAVQALVSGVTELAAGDLVTMVGFNTAASNPGFQAGDQNTFMYGHLVTRL